MRDEVAKRLTLLEELLKQSKVQYETARKELQDTEQFLQMLDLKNSATVSNGEEVTDYTLVYLVPDDNQGSGCLYIRPKQGSTRDGVSAANMDVLQLKAAMELLPLLIDNLNACHTQLEVK